MEDSIGGLLGMLGGLYVIAPIIQIITAIHCLKTGRNWYWLWIIFVFPIVGTVVYFFVEITPDLKGFTLSGFIDSILNSVIPGRKLKHLQSALEESDTVKNRKDLAAYYLSARENGKAVEMYRSCLSGVFKDDPDILLNYAIALVEDRQFEEAKKILEGLAKNHPHYYVPRRELLYAKSLEGLGQEGPALKAFEAIVQRHASEVEAWWRYGKLLEKEGKRDLARESYLKILKQVKGFSSPHRRSQLVWIKAIKKSLKEIKG